MLNESSLIMSKAIINKNILQWAIDRSGKSLAILEKDFPKIQTWLNGEDHPTMHQLENLAKKTYTPLGFFFLDEPPQEILPIPHFRTIKDYSVNKPSPNLIDTINTMLQRQFWMRDFLINEGHNKLPFVNSVKLADNAVAVAEKMKAVLQLESEWASRQNTWGDSLRVLRQAMEKAGIIIAVNGVVGTNTRRILDPDEFRGFVLVDDYAPLVFMNARDCKAAQMFTLAHELAHVFYGKSAAFDLNQMKPADDRTEQACNLAAAEFLVPENILRCKWNLIKHDTDPFNSLARFFKVSPIVAARRALDIGLITKRDFSNFYSEYLKISKARQTSGGNFYLNEKVRIGENFARAVILAAMGGKILYSEAFRLTGLHGKTFDNYACSLGLAG